MGGDAVLSKIKENGSNYGKSVLMSGDENLKEEFEKKGFGKFKWKNGALYEGEFDNDMLNGRGTYTFPDGKKYNGQWKNNKMDGHGRFEWPDGRVYEGEYKDGKKEGIGEYRYPDGRIYKGMWKDGKQQGKGMFYIQEKKIWKKGIWSNGKRIEWIDEDNKDNNINEVSQ